MSKHLRIQHFPLFLSACLYLSSTALKALESGSEPEILCMSANTTCTGFLNEEQVHRNPETDEFSLNFLKFDILEAAIAGKAGLAPEKHSAALKSITPASLRKLQLHYSRKLIDRQFEKGKQTQKDCLQFAAIGIEPMLVLQAMRHEKGPALYTEVVRQVKSINTASLVAWNPKYSLPGSTICKMSDEAITEAKIDNFLKLKGMRGYIEGLRTLTAEARLPKQYIGYLVYADGSDDYSVTQSFGTKALASSLEDSTPLIIDFGSDAPLSEGSVLEGLYLYLVGIGPYTTAAGTQRNAFFFKAVNGSDIPQVARLK